MEPYEITLVLSTDNEGAWVCTCSNPFRNERVYIVAHETAAGALEEMMQHLAEEAFDRIEEI
jgi:hypothetical protein